MKLKVFLLGLLVSSVSFAATEEFDFLGNRITIKSKDKKDLKVFVAKMNEHKDLLFKGLDNECMYTDARTEDCRQEIDYSLNTKIKVKDIVAETKKNYKQSFLESNKDSNKASLLNGLSLIDSSREASKKPFQINYYGQLLQTKGSNKTLHISSPLLPSVSFIKAPSYEGWIVSASHEDAGGPGLDKKSRKKKQDFLKVVLFAPEGFSGARLYGWSQALIKGGKKLLKKLEKNKKYKNQWAYIYFDQNATPVCSKNIKCNFSDSLNRKVSW